LASETRVSEETRVPRDPSWPFCDFDQLLKPLSSRPPQPCAGRLTCPVSLPDSHAVPKAVEGGTYHGTCSMYLDWTIGGMQEREFSGPKPIARSALAGRPPPTVPAITTVYP